MSAVTADAPAAAPAADPAAAPPAPTSILAQAAQGATPAANADDWTASIPEKYVVKNAEGVFDPAQSVPKLVQAYNELVKRMVAGESPPADSDAYEVKDLPHGIDFAELKKDEKFRGWLKGAHSKGMNNAQIQHAMEGLSEFIVGDISYTKDEGTAELRAVWKTEAEFKANAGAAWRAANIVSQKTGIPFAEIEATFGNNPMWLRAMAVFGRELAEDTAPAGGGWVPGGDIDAQIRDTRDKLEKMPMHDRSRPALQEQLMALYNRKVPGGTTKAASFTG